jgi:hypothetical protein
MVAARSASFEDMPNGSMAASNFSVTWPRDALSRSNHSSDPNAILTPAFRAPSILARSANTY